VEWRSRSGRIFEAEDFGKNLTPELVEREQHLREKLTAR
jgi:hypothetical protein